MKAALCALGVWGAALSAGVAVVVVIDSALCRVSLYRLPRAFVLDTLTGPAEEFEFVGATTPIRPPTTQ